ncbi:MAG: hypothetical protein F6K21_34360 [Symploca sp. SIO2D2]|nr:hypothetical protein [Symploca sp. SIO2D2]
MLPFPINLYSHKGLEDSLQDALGKDTKIGEITDSSQKPVLLIPAYDTLTRRTEWFCSNNPVDKPLWYNDIEVWKICTASASAPTFFPPRELKTPTKETIEKMYVDQTVRDHINLNLTKKGRDLGEKYPFVDGGIAVNNPAIMAIAHAILTPDRQMNLDEIAILSIGTGTPTKPYTYKEVKNWGMVQWAIHINDLFIPAPNELTSDVCWQLIRGKSDDNAKVYYALISG